MPQLQSATKPTLSAEHPTGTDHTATISLDLAMSLHKWPYTAQRHSQGPAEWQHSKSSGSYGFQAHHQYVVGGTSIFTSCNELHF